MIKFHDYNPSEPFAVNNEWHYVSDGNVVLDYTPKQGTVKVKLDGVEATETTSRTPNAGQFYIDYAVSSDYRMATQQVIFNDSDNGKRATFDYQGVSTLIRAKHLNEIRDFMNHYNEDRARTLVRGEAPPRVGESVETFTKPKLTNTLKIGVIGTVGTMITVDSTDGLEVGNTYTISDGNKFEEFEVAFVNSEDKVVTAVSLNNVYDAGWICISTATILKGKAFVSGDMQKIEWDTREEWKGKKGEVVTSHALDTQKATMSGISLNELGEFEVENVDSGMQIILTPYRKPVCQSFSRTSHQPIAPYKNGINGNTDFLFLKEDSSYCLDAEEAGFTIESKKVTLANGSSSSTAYRIPPLWGKTTTVPLEGKSARLLFLSLFEKEGYTLFNTFKDHPNGFWISNYPGTLPVGFSPATCGMVNIAALYVTLFLNTAERPAYFSSMHGWFPQACQYCAFKANLSTETVIGLSADNRKSEEYVYDSGKLPAIYGWTFDVEKEVFVPISNTQETPQFACSSNSTVIPAFGTISASNGSFYYQEVE